MSIILILRKMLKYKLTSSMKITHKKRFKGIYLTLLVEGNEKMKWQVHEKETGLVFAEITNFRLALHGPNYHTWNWEYHCAYQKEINEAMESIEILNPF